MLQIIMKSTMIHYYINSKTYEHKIKFTLILFQKIQNLYFLSNIYKLYHQMCSFLNICNLNININTALLKMDIR